MFPIHSHNDELQCHPLREALESKCQCVEPDVWLMDGKFVLGHDAPTQRTLADEYIEPLIKMFKARKCIYDRGPMILLVDSKVEEAHQLRISDTHPETFYDQLNDWFTMLNNENPG